MFNNGTFYVYRHISPDGRTIYVGKGKEGRAWGGSKRDKYHLSIISKYDHDYVEIVAANLTEPEALLLERSIIREEDPPANIQERIK